ncbi:MAG: Fur family transcriptional regulator [Trichodesmium sp. St16_bin4-tuft]|uniref:Ferric uptake regulator, Fur family n=1 Tax=Trichodesmium erythraeum (strain IMS101) TaxID=203124 RepID=Q113W8_TRIEI|nr:transcriptional repressor [Trichodesmium erythraeum GBRTRLIN201]MCH2049301.1 transcriptional repressor [Trichodesmium sp. ALOHA_ZT_67]MCL2927209.1 transcriptional repressor [Trichodesmium sp. MAG_R01]MDE5068323.1 Fur family transcriptional regulator [Trichodesmium sp. St4_bin8_1]MDE5073098.1 Fur family transcriptional regulator [Trichodesmium sp. St5_bin8]MDE5094142.1 Fur family transcriptional regulator [Trichodesmium sp. St11_bin5]MDE5096963.1 Fur family transcriptional regulator [Tricho
MKTKRTHSQERILKLLKNQKRSLSAQDIYLKLRRYDRPLGLATIYRSLDALKKEGVVIVRTLVNGESVYSCLQQDQYYLNCVKCGTSIPINKCPVYNLEDKLQQSYKFKIFYHTLEFFGLCERCTLTEDIS